MEDHSFFSSRPVNSSRIEIVCIEEGAGVLITGKDRIKFESGDILMTGTHLCHQYKLDQACMRNQVRVSVLRFVPDFWGDIFLNLNENVYIKALLKKANLGVKPSGQTRVVVRELMAQLMLASGTGTIILLLEILHTISISSDLRFLSSEHEFPHHDELDRMEKIYAYSRNNFYRKIDLEEIAAVAYVSPNSFCRFFKSKAKKTYSRFLIELRVRHACHLLIESRLCAKRICVESGFNNFSNFHKCFKEITGKSPIEYQKEFKSVALFG